MRPLSLKISGFRSHMETTEVNFEDRTLTAIVGPTGAGKSSILEAISYALYAKTPREQRAVKRLICSSCDTARVEFRFLIDEREYSILRVLRRSGAGQHIIEDLSSGEKLSGEGAVSNHVTGLLGLGFDAFSSSVLLAQGQFAKFLEATPKERGVILKGIFRLDQIDELQKAAKARRETLDGDLKLIEGERNAIPEDVALLLKSALRAEKEASARAAVLESAIPREKDLLKAISDIERSRAEHLSMIERTRTMTARLPQDGELQELAREERDLRLLQDHAEESVRVAEDAHSVAVDQHDALERDLGSEVDLVQAAALARTRESLADQIQRLEKQRSTEEERRKAAAKASAQADRKLVTAGKVLRTVREEHRNLERMHSAQDLRGRLKPGEPCPVCEQRVRRLPRVEPPAKIAEAAAKETEAATAEAAAVTEARGAATALAALEAGLAASSELLVRLGKDMKLAQEELAGVGGSSDISGTEIEARLVKIRAARALVGATRDSAKSERARVDHVRQETKSFEKRQRDESQKLIELCAQADLPAPTSAAPAASLAKHATSVRHELARRVEQTQNALGVTESRLDEVTHELQELRTKLDLPPEGLIESVFAEAHAAAGVARNQAATAEKQLARSKELTKEAKAVTSRRALFNVLATDLTAQRFIAFLLEDRTRLLLELGSERLHTMTSNRYRLELDEKNDLEIIDELDADKRRSVDTLSGGETFLASLALAIALAEVVTRAGGRLQCFFLDEGFGTLDPESFDLAMDGIEKIVTPDRLIGLVSHVPALRDRIEDQIILEKGEDGMSRVASGQAG
jgi:DNA repair protein SbcC/Rad50